MTDAEGDVASDIVTRLRRWTHDVHAVPASDLMNQAAHAIVELRRQLAALRDERHRCRTLHLHLSDEERCSIEVACQDLRHAEEVDILRGLLDRTR